MLLPARGVAAFRTAIRFASAPIIRCGAALFDQLDKAEILAYRKDDYQWNVLVADKEKARRKYKNAVVDDATIDDILLLYVKGEQAK